MTVLGRGVTYQSPHTTQLPARRDVPTRLRRERSVKGRPTEGGRTESG